MRSTWLLGRMGKSEGQYVCVDQIQEIIALSSGRKMEMCASVSHTMHSAAHQLSSRADERRREKRFIKPLIFQVQYRNPKSAYALMAETLFRKVLACMVQI